MYQETLVYDAVSPWNFNLALLFSRLLKRIQTTRQGSQKGPEEHSGSLFASECAEEACTRKQWAEKVREGKGLLELWQMLPSHRIQVCSSQSSSWKGLITLLLLLPIPVQTQQTLIKNARDGGNNKAVLFKICVLSFAFSDYQGLLNATKTLSKAGGGRGWRTEL